MVLQVEVLGGGLVVLFAWAVLGSLSTPLCLRAGVGHASEL
jgi:hypothetical protein